MSVPSSASRAGRAFLLGTAVLALVLGLRITAPDDIDSLDQAKQGLYVVDAYHEGRWLVPLESGSMYPTKPPLLTWISLGIAGLEGRVSALGCRAPSIAAAVLLLAATVAFARRLGPVESATAALALVANQHVVKCAWLARTDMLLAALTAAATAATFESYMAWRTGEGSARRRFLVAAALMGLGTVAKSPVALACPLFSLGFFLVFRGELRAFVGAIGPRTLALGAAVYVALTGAWLLPAAIVAGRPFVHTLWNELLGHTAGTGEYSDPEKARPFYYPLGHLAGQFLPWTVVFVLPAIFIRWRSFVPALVAVRKSPDEATLARTFAVAALAGSVAFFAFALRIKRADHVLPCYPWIAIATGTLVARWAEGRGEGPGVAFRVIGVLGCALTPVLPILLAGSALLARLPAPVEALLGPAFLDCFHALSWRPGLVIGAAALAAPAGALAWAGGARRRPALALAGTTALAALFVAVYYHGFSPFVRTGKPVAQDGFCEAARRLVGDRPVSFLRVPPGVTFLMERSQTVAPTAAAARAELASISSALVTDDAGAREVVLRRPDLVRALTSPCYWKAGKVWQLELLLPEGSATPTDPSGGAASVWW
jgi:4-amino-4-deoxy-L-arabinose transferase-like glycosyltransferase